MADVSTFALFGPCCKYGILPRCEFYNGNCPRLACLSAMVPSTWKLPIQLAPKFACIQCWLYFVKAWNTPIKGIDRLADAPEDWRPSLMDMMRHAQIAMTFEARKTQLPAEGYLDDYWRNYEVKRGLTPAQRDQSRIHRALIRKYAAISSDHRGSQ